MRRILNQAVMLTALMGLFLCSAAQAELAVIAHPDIGVDGVTEKELSAVYLGHAKRLSNDAFVTPVDQSEGSAQRKHFYKTVTGKSEAQLKRYWSKRMFSGKGKPPIVLGSDQAVKEWVAKTPGGLGYIDGKELDSSVKVLLILP